MIFLLHWHEKECKRMCDELTRLGWQTMPCTTSESLSLAQLRTHQPQAIIISLRRLPSHGKQVALAVQSTRLGSALPLVFVDGEPAKLSPLQSRFPNALFTDWVLLPSVLNTLGISPQTPTPANLPERSA
ncbi:MAG TPA: hypothetical protein PK299_11950 [Anaerolineales bacterium]|nr:hypothetical protein [Anaerolineales bacterium]